MAERAIRVFSVLPNRANGYSLRTTQTSCCAQPQGLNSRPESKRELGDTRSVSLSNTSRACRARAKTLESSDSCWGRQPSDACRDAAAMSISGPRTTGVMRKGARLETGNSRCETGFAREYQPSRDGVERHASMRSGGVAPRRVHTAQTACSTQASATSAIPVFVAGVSAEHDGGPAFRLGRGRRSHTEAA
jgi:hypothetical protein